MLKQLFLAVSLVLMATALGAAQSSNSNSNTSPTRTRTVAPKPSPAPAGTETSPAAGPQTQQPKTTQTQVVKPAGPAAGVLAAFDKIIEGVRRANVDMSTGGYWNSNSLVLFNYNGSVTKGWEQMRRNRESSYPDIKDAKLDIRDKHVQMLGRDGAVVTCLWNQSQTFKGQPDTASGRMTLVFKRFGTEWKAIHLHTSPDKPDPLRVPASEQIPPSMSN